MWRFSAGPWYTISFSSGVRSRNGTSVRTPISRAMSFIRDHISEPQGATAPWSMVSESSGTSVDSSTVRMIPVPEQVRQAPSLLKASCSAPGAYTLSPQTGQNMGCSAATSRVGSR